MSSLARQRGRPPAGFDPALIDACWRGGGAIFLSAVSAWEIALLVDAGRIDLDIPVEAWIERFLGRPGVEAAPESSRRLPQLSAASFDTAILQTGC